jgi:LmbE family N-acetylglucosaminyl deacetylase
MRREFAISHDLLGIPIEDREVFMFKVRHFPRDRQEILEVLVQLNLSYQPDLVLMPSTGDTHQDHKTIAEEAFRAFKRTSMWAYEVPWNQQVSKVNCFVSVSEEELQKKINAIEAYESQKHRKYTTNQFIRSLAVVRGGQMGVPLAEGFEIVRQINI